MSRLYSFCRLLLWVASISALNSTLSVGQTPTPEHPPEIDGINMIPPPIDGLMILNVTTKSSDFSFYDMKKWETRPIESGKWQTVYCSDCPNDIITILYWDGHSTAERAMQKHQQYVYYWDRRLSAFDLKTYENFMSEGNDDLVSH
jgi:hypothetical protein